MKTYGTRINFDSKKAVVGSIALRKISAAKVLVLVLAKVLLFLRIKRHHLTFRIVPITIALQPNLDICIDTEVTLLKSHRTVHKELAVIRHMNDIIDELLLSKTLQRVRSC